MRITRAELDTIEDRLRALEAVVKSMTGALLAFRQSAHDLSPFGMQQALNVLRESLVLPAAEEPTPPPPPRRGNIIVRRPERPLFWNAPSKRWLRDPQRATVYASMRGADPQAKLLRRAHPDVAVVPACWGYPLEKR